MKWLIPETEEIDYGIMYELFDKDNNGVIDLEEFVGYFRVCSSDILLLLKVLIEKGHSFTDLQDQRYFIEASKEAGESNVQTIEEAY